MQPTLKPILVETMNQCLTTNSSESKDVYVYAASIVPQLIALIITIDPKEKVKPLES